MEQQSTCLVTQSIPQETKENIDKQVNNILKDLGLDEFLETINSNPELQKQIVTTINSLDESCSIKNSGGKRKKLHKKMKGGMFLIPKSLLNIFTPIFEEFMNNTIRNPNAIKNFRTNIQNIVTNFKRGGVNKMGDVSALAIATILLSLIIYLSACYSAYIYTPPILDRIPMWAQDIIQKIVYDEQRCLSTIPNYFSSICTAAETRLYFGLRYLLFKMFLILNFTSISGITAVSSAIVSPDGKINLFNITNLLINMGNVTGLPSKIKAIVERMVGLATPEERHQIREIAHEMLEEEQIENPDMEINEEALDNYLQNNMDGGFKQHQKIYKKNYKRNKKTKRKKYINKVKRRKTQKKI